MKIGFWELVVVVIVAFVFIGPDQLPVYAKKIGKMLRELKKYTGVRPKSRHCFEGFHIIVFQLINILSHRILY